MNLEHRRQKVAPLPHFFLRPGRYGFFSIMLIVVSTGIGTLGYHYFKELHWLTSFHMACMILTGMEPVEEMKTKGAKLFSSFYALYKRITS